MDFETTGRHCAFRVKPVRGKKPERKNIYALCYSGVSPCSLLSFFRPVSDETTKNDIGNRTTAEKVNARMFEKHYSASGSRGREITPDRTILTNKSGDCRGHDDISNSITKSVSRVMFALPNKKEDLEITKKREKKTQMTMLSCYIFLHYE